MSGSFKNCKDISPSCPVQGTTYGYYPALGPNAFLLALFALCCLAQLTIGVWKRVYSYSFALAFGAFLEALGYGGRVMMHSNPWDGNGFKIQIICLIIGPSFVAAGIYLTLKHLTLQHDPELSLLKPKLYTWVFIGCDAGSIVLQAAGGGVAAVAEDNKGLLDAGNSIINAGIAFQVATMVICGLLAAVYMFRRWRHSQDMSSLAVTVLPWKTRFFMSAVVFAYITVLVRCIYRLPEMAGGWGNPMMRNEKEFLILDGMMIVLAVVALTVAHPFYLLPAMRTGYTGDEEKIELHSRGEGSNSPLRT